MEQQFNNDKRRNNEIDVDVLKHTIQNNLNSKDILKKSSIFLPFNGHRIGRADITEDARLYIDIDSSVVDELDRLNENKFRLKSGKKIDLLHKDHSLHAYLDHENQSDQIGDLINVIERLNNNVNGLTYNIKKLKIGEKDEGDGPSSEIQDIINDAKKAEEEENSRERLCFKENDLDIIIALLSDRLTDKIEEKDFKYIAGVIIDARLTEKELNGKMNYRDSIGSARLTTKLLQDSIEGKSMDDVYQNFQNQIDQVLLKYGLEDELKTLLNNFSDEVYEDGLSQKERIHREISKWDGEKLERYILYRKDTSGLTFEFVKESIERTK